MGGAAEGRWEEGRCRTAGGGQVHRTTAAPAISCRQCRRVGAGCASPQLAFVHQSCPPSRAPSPPHTPPCALVQTLKRLSTETAQLPPDMRPTLASDPRPPSLGLALGLGARPSARLRSFAAAELLLDDSYWAAAAVTAAAAAQGAAAAAGGGGLALGAARHLEAHRQHLVACRQLQVGVVGCGLRVRLVAADGVENGHAVGKWGAGREFAERGCRDLG